MTELSERFDLLVPERKLWCVTYAVGSGKARHTAYFKAKHAAIARIHATLSLRKIHGAPIRVLQILEHKEPSAS